MGKARPQVFERFFEVDITKVIGLRIGIRQEVTGFFDAERYASPRFVPVIFLISFFGWSARFK